MSTFTPSAYAEVPALAADTKGIPRRLMRYYAPTDRGRTVYWLSDGTVTETDPDSNAVFWTASDGSPYVETVWWGSTASAYEVTSEQATALTNAGYTVV